MVRSEEPGTAAVMDDRKNKPQKNRRPPRWRCAPSDPDPQGSRGRAHRVSGFPLAADLHNDPVSAGPRSYI